MRVGYIGRIDSDQQVPRVTQGSLAAVPPASRPVAACLARPVVWLCLLVALFTAYFLAFNLASHAAFDTSAYDLGIYDQVVWNTAHGRVMAYSAEPWYSSNFLGTHLQPILILLAPVYWVWSDPRALIVLQSLAIGASAFLVYFLAARRLARPWAALALTFAYLMWPALQAVTRFDFHPESFEPLLFLGAFALYEIWRGRIVISRLPRRWARVLFFVAIVLALLVKEDVALVVAAFGIYLWAARRERRLGPLLLIAGLVWFAAGMLLVMPRFRGGEGSPFLTYYAYLGKTPAEMARTLVTQPQVALKALAAPANLDMLLGLLVPLGLLPLLAPDLLLISLPTLISYGLSTNAFMHRMEGFHYAATVIPWFILAAIYGLGRWYDGRGIGPLRGVARRVPWLPLVVLLVASCAYQGGRGFTPVSRLYQWPQVTEHERTGRALMKQIPPDASLVAQDKLYPHLSQRQAISFLWPSDASAEYVLLDVSDPTLTNGDRLTEWLKAQIEAQSAYGLVESRDGFVLLKRGAPHQALSGAFYSFATPSEPAIQHPMSVDTPEGIRFLGYDVVKRRYENTLLTLYFTATERLTKDYFAGVHLLGEDGATLGATKFQQPALVWYPTSQWQPGEIVKVTVNTLGWAAEPERFGLGVVLAGPDVVPGNSDAPDTPRVRLKWLPGATEPQPRLLEDQTVLKLGDFAR